MSNKEIKDKIDALEEIYSNLPDLDQLILIAAWLHVRDIRKGVDVTKKENTEVQDYLNQLHLDITKMGTLIEEIKNLTE